MTSHISIEWTGNHCRIYSRFREVRAEHVGDDERGAIIRFYSGRDDIRGYVDAFAGDDARKTVDVFASEMLRELGAPRDDL